MEIEYIAVTIDQPLTDEILNAVSDVAQNIALIGATPLFSSDRNSVSTRIAIKVPKSWSVQDTLRAASELSYLGFVQRVLTVYSTKKRSEPKYSLSGSDWVQYAR